MANYGGTTGKWLDVNDDLDGKKLKFVNECVQELSSKFKNKDGEFQMTNLVKARVQGAEESVNMRPNWTSIGAMRDAFGPDSKEWIGKVVTVRVKDATTGQSAYLIPDGFELYRNEEKRWAIRKVGTENGEKVIQTEESPDPVAPTAPAAAGVQYPDEEINPEDIPF